MSEEWSVDTLIDAFQHSERPFLLAYGRTPRFASILSDFRKKLLSASAVPYLFCDMELAKRDCYIETCVEILYQLVYWFTFLSRGVETRQQQLAALLERLESLSLQVEKCGSLEDRVILFVDFRETFFLPVLKELAGEKLILELNRFETVAEWGGKIRNYVLAPLLDIFPKGALRYVIFHKGLSEPSLAYGSAEEAMRAQIEPYRILEPLDDTDRLESGSYDVFLSYHDEDRKQVESLAAELQYRGVKAWIEKWGRIPGRSYREEIDRLLPLVKAIFMLVGQNGIVPWQDLEIRTLLSRAVQEEMPVIPVLLPGAVQPSQPPLFLEDSRWVEFRSGIHDAEALELLVSLIKEQSVS